MSIELISALIGFLLTLMVFSYLIGDNPLFRVAIYLFIGVSSGYAATVIVNYVLIPRLGSLQGNEVNQWILVTIPLLFGITLFAKLFPRFSWIGNFAMAVLVGVGAAVAIGGALLGTLMPQLGFAISMFDLRAGGGVARLLQGVVMLGGTVFTLASFHFSVGRASRWHPQAQSLLSKELPGLDASLLPSHWVSCLREFICRP